MYCIQPWGSSTRTGKQTKQKIVSLAKSPVANANIALRELVSSVRVTAGGGGGRRRVNKLARPFNSQFSPWRRPPQWRAGGRLWWRVFRVSCCSPARSQTRRRCWSLSLSSCHWLASSSRHHRHCQRPRSPSCEASSLYTHTSRLRERGRQMMGGGRERSVDDIMAFSLRLGYSFSLHIIGWCRGRPHTLFTIHSIWQILCVERRWRPTKTTHVLACC